VLTRALSRSRGRPMDWEMVLRRPLMLVLSLLAPASALVVVAPPRAALAQSQAYDDDGGGTYGDGAYDDPYDETGAYDADQDAPGDMTATIPVVPATPTPIASPGPTPIAPVQTLPTVAITKTIAGRTARMRTDGKAAIPRGAPRRVQEVIAAANRIIGKPYLWGGGHAKLVDRGYDCSGSVSYALIGAQLLGSPLVSGSLAHWGTGGAGRWISIYANKGHVYMEVAGLRLDTSPWGDVTHRMGVRWRPLIGKRSGFATRHPAGL
jgi:cell wall-associated NlpC family hydrolase